MLEVPNSTDIWSYHAKGEWIAITTNPIINSKGGCVMGRGVALQAKLRFPNLPRELACFIQEHGNRCCAFPAYRILTFPVKTHWKLSADRAVILRSCLSAPELLNLRGIPRLYLPRPGCGNGGLNWSEVRPLIADLLDDRFIIVHR